MTENVPKIIQITTTSLPFDECHIHALADDGSIWKWDCNADDPDWFKLTDGLSDKKRYTNQNVNTSYILR